MARATPAITAVTPDWVVLFAVPLWVAACGDVTANTITVGNSRNFATPDATTTVPDAAPDATPGCAPGSLEFRSLLLIKAQAQVNGTDYALSQTEVDIATTGFMTTVPDWANRITNGRLCFIPEVYASPDPLTSFTNTCGGPTPWKSDVAGDLQRLAPAGTYDTVYVYAPNGGSAGSCAYWPAADSNYTAFAYLDPPGENSWQDPNHYIYDHVIWAWTIGFYGFYQRLSGVEPPDVPDPSRGENYGYARDQAPYSGWKTFYGDILNRNVMQNGVASGLGEPAWAHGTMRAAAAQ